MDFSEYFKMVLPGNSAAPKVCREALEIRAMTFALQLKEAYAIDDIGIRGEASETNSSTLADAYEVYSADWSPGDNKANEFLRIIRNLSSEELEFLAAILKHDYYRKKYGEKAYSFMAPSCVDCRPDDGKKVTDDPGAGAGAGDDGFVMKSAVPTMVGVFAKTVADEFISNFGRGDLIPWAKPYVDASTAGGVLLVGSAVVLTEKKPWLSKIMVKLGAMAIAFSTLFPMALALPPVPALVFGLLVAFILVATAALV